MPSLTKRLGTFLKHAWNVFSDEDFGQRIASYSGGGYGHRPDRTRLRFSNERSIIASIYTRLAIDASTVDIRHVRRDADGRYVEDIQSGLQNCLTLEANLDQAARHFRRDAFLTLFDEGTIAIVPVDTSMNPTTGSFDIRTVRVGKVVAWFSEHVRVNLYNQKTGLREDITIEKKFVAIIENPLYTVMNEHNSTLQRLIRTINRLDVVDEQTASGKLDLIIQLPYAIRSEVKRQQAKQRKIDLEEQLLGSKYGIAYTDGTEKITQLNRPAENNLLKQVELLTELLYTQLGLTTEVMNGTADEAAMLNYYNRTIEPIVNAVVEGMRRAFLTKTARSQGQWIMAFRDRLGWVPMKDFADIADKLTRSEVASSNELRQAIGWKPSTDPKADELRNTNMPLPTDPAATDPTAGDPNDRVVQDALAGLDDVLNGIFTELGVDENVDA